MMCGHVADAGGGDHARPDLGHPNATLLALYGPPLGSDHRRADVWLGADAYRGVLSCVVDAIYLQRRLQDRTVAEWRADDLRVRVMFYRVGALMVACLAIGLASSFGGGPVLVLVISLILVYVDLFPRRLVKIFG
jgi:hypothetical protein